MTNGPGCTASPLLAVEDTVTRTALSSFDCRGYLVICSGVSVGMIAVRVIRVL